MNEYGLLIDGAWRPAQGGRTLEVINPASGRVQATAALEAARANPRLTAVIHNQALKRTS